MAVAAPLALLLGLVLVYPIIEVIRLSFTDATLVTGEPYTYSTDAYRQLLVQRGFPRTLVTTLTLRRLSTVFQLALGLGAALLVNGAERRGLRGAVFTRTIVLTAWAVPGVIIGIIWGLLYGETQSGILNYGLSLLGSPARPRSSPIPTSPWCR